MIRLEEFGFRALWSPYFLLFCLLVIGLFFYMAIKKRHLFEGTDKLTKWEGGLFTFTIILLYVIKGSPIDLLGHLMFTFHMLQMAILFLLIPQLLIISIPSWMWKRIVELPIIRQFFHFFTKPLIALLLFNGLFSFYHLPFIFDIIKTDIFYHAFYTSLVFVFSLFMWWPLLNRIDEAKQLSGLKKVGYLFADSVLITPACALIIFNPEPMYETYTNTELWMKSLELCVPVDMLANLNLAGPEMFNPLPLNYDQQLGGVIMKVLQEIFYGAILYKIFIEWYRKEQNEPDLSSYYENVSSYGNTVNGPQKDLDSPNTVTSFDKLQNKLS